MPASRQASPGNPCLQILSQVRCSLNNGYTHTALTCAPPHAGAVILTAQPYKVGDCITVKGICGTVRDVDMMMTEIETITSRTVVSLANIEILKGTIENFSRSPIREWRAKVVFSHQSAPDAVRATLAAACCAADSDAALAQATAAYAQDPTNPPVPVPEFVLLGFSDQGSQEWECRYRFPSANYWHARSVLNEEIAKAVQKAGHSVGFARLELANQQTPTAEK